MSALRALDGGGYVVAVRCRGMGPAGGGAGFSGRGVEGCWRGGEVTGSKVADS